ncbi:HK97-gp10 family putative phage morphogenesis protein [Enterococcus sp. LJL99]
MAIQVDVSDAQQALKRLEKKAESAEKEAVEQASKFIAQTLEKNTPVWTGKKSKGKRGSYMNKHASSEVVYMKVKNGESFVGYSDEVSWRMHFVEFGTFKQLPQAVVQKTQTQIEQEVLSIMEKVIKGALLG